MDIEFRPDIFPGKKLEDFIKWYLNIVINTVHTDPTAFRLAMEDRVIQPTILEQWQFEALIELFEPYRIMVEKSLNEFDSDQNSWSDYLEFKIVFIPDNLFRLAQRLLVNNFSR